MASYCTETVPVDHAFDVLAASPRRRVLHELHVETTTADEWLHLPTSEWVGDDVSRLALRHQHLPRLEREGLIEWDADGDLIRRGCEFGTFEPLLEVFDEERDALPFDWP